MQKKKVNTLCDPDWFWKTVVFHVVQDWQDRKFLLTVSLLSRWHYDRVQKMLTNPVYLNVWKTRLLQGALKSKQDYKIWAPRIESWQSLQQVLHYGCFHHDKKNHAQITQISINHWTTFWFESSSATRTNFVVPKFWDLLHNLRNIFFRTVVINNDTVVRHKITFEGGLAACLSTLFNLDQLFIEQLDMRSMLVPRCFDSLSHLTSLELKNVELTSIPDHLFTDALGRHLLLLDLSQNPFQLLPSGCFDKLSKLEKLIIDKNSLFYLEDECFCKLTNLRLLSLSYSYVMTKLPRLLLKGLEKLETLCIDRSSSIDAIPSSDFFKYVPHLSNLQLWKTWISVFPNDCFAPLTELRSIFFSFNGLIKMDLKSMPSIWGDGFYDFIPVSDNNTNNKTRSLITAQNKQLEDMSEDLEDLEKIAKQNTIQLGTSKMEKLAKKAEHRAHKKR